MGRDAVNVAGAFAERLALDGLVLTKLDGDARGGAALAVKAETGVPIKFLGTGESVDRLEEFRPEGLASRILGMGDIVGLVRDFEEVVDARQAEADAERLLKGQFGMDDLLTQLRTIQKIGPLRDVFAKLPMFGELADQVDERELGRVEAMIQSMTPRGAGTARADQTRAAPGGSRGAAAGAKHEVGELVKRFGQMREMMARWAARAAAGCSREFRASESWPAPVGTGRNPGRLRPHVDDGRDGQSSDAAAGKGDGQGRGEEEAQGGQGRPQEEPALRPQPSSGTSKEPNRFVR